MLVFFPEHTKGNEMHIAKGPCICDVAYQTRNHPRLFAYNPEKTKIKHSFRYLRSVLAKIKERGCEQQEQSGKDRANYGEYLITRLSVYLGEQLGKGFSVANLKNFRQFYLVFPKRKSYTLCSQLSWSHIRLIRTSDRWICMSVCLTT